MNCNKKCEMCERKTLRSEEEKKKLINRLNRIEGQVRGLKGMVERNSYCADILVQSAAVNAAINSFNRDLLSKHIKSCVMNDIKSGNDGAAEELIHLLEKMMK